MKQAITRILGRRPAPVERRRPGWKTARELVDDAQREGVRRMLIHYLRTGRLDCDAYQNAQGATDQGAE